MKDYKYKFPVDYSGKIPIVKWKDVQKLINTSVIEEKRYKGIGKWDDWEEIDHEIVDFNSSFFEYLDEGLPRDISLDGIIIKNKNTGKHYLSQFPLIPYNNTDENFGNNNIYLKELKLDTKLMIVWQTVEEEKGDDRYYYPFHEFDMGLNHKLQYLHIPCYELYDSILLGIDNEKFKIKHRFVVGDVYDLRSEFMGHIVSSYGKDYFVLHQSLRNLSYSMVRLYELGEEALVSCFSLNDEILPYSSFSEEVWYPRSIRNKESDKDIDECEFEYMQFIKDSRIRFESSGKEKVISIFKLNNQDFYYFVEKNLIDFPISLIPNSYIQMIYFSNDFGSDDTKYYVPMYRNFFTFEDKDDIERFNQRK